MKTVKKTLPLQISGLSADERFHRIFAVGGIVFGWTQAFGNGLTEPISIYEVVARNFNNVSDWQYQTTTEK